MRRTVKRLWLVGGCHWQIDGEGGPASGKCFRLNVSAVLTNDGHADAEAEAGAATGARRGVEGIKDARKRLRVDADAVILNGDHSVIIVVTGTDLDAAGVADFLDGLLGVGDKIQKNLDKLVGVADHAGKIRLRAEIHGDVVAAKRVFVQLEGSLEEAIDVERSFLRRSRAREFEEILDDTRGAPRLAVGKIQLALAGVIGSVAFAEKFGNTEDRRERIVQFIGDTIEHLPHGL